MVSEIANFSKNLLSLRHMNKGLKSFEVKGSWLDYILLLSSLIIIWGAIVYYVYALNTLGIILILVLTGFSLFLIKNSFSCQRTRMNRRATAPPNQKIL